MSESASKHARLRLEAVAVAQLCSFCARRVLLRSTALSNSALLARRPCADGKGALAPTRPVLSSTLVRRLAASLSQGAQLFYRWTESTQTYKHSCQTLAQSAVPADAGRMESQLVLLLFSTSAQRKERRRTSLKVLARLARDVVVVPLQLAVELAVLLVDPGDVALVLVGALARPLLPLVEAARDVLESVSVL